MQQQGGLFSNATQNGDVLQYNLLKLNRRES